jgi:hypothetical protein
MNSGGLRGAFPSVPSVFGSIVFSLLGSRKVGDSQEPRAAGRYLRDPSTPPGSDPEHRDSASALAIEACDFHAGTGLGTPEGALDLGTRSGLASEEQDRRISLRGAGSVGDLLIDRLQFGSRVSSRDLTSSDAREEGSAEGIAIGKLDRNRGSIASEAADSETDQARCVLVSSEGSDHASDVENEEVCHRETPRGGFAVSGRPSPSHTYNVTCKGQPVKKKVEVFFRFSAGRVRRRSYICNVTCWGRPVKKNRSESCHAL